MMALDLRRVQAAQSLPPSVQRTHLDSAILTRLALVRGFVRPRRLIKRDFLPQS
jgi:hypothetical protein